MLSHIYKIYIYNCVFVYQARPEDIVNLVNEYGAFMRSSNIPKLFINADPGSILIGDQREFARSWKNQTEITVSGNHFIQEDSSEEIGAALRNFVESL